MIGMNSDSHESTAKSEQISISRWNVLASSCPDPSRAIKLVINENTKGTLRCNLLKLNKNHRNFWPQECLERRKGKERSELQVNFRSGARKEIKYLNKSRDWCLNDWVTDLLKCWNTRLTCRERSEGEDEKQSILILAHKYSLRLAGALRSFRRHLDEHRETASRATQKKTTKTNIMQFKMLFLWERNKH